MLKYRGYTGHAEYDDEAGVFHGEAIDASLASKFASEGLCRYSARGQKPKSMDSGEIGTGLLSPCPASSNPGRPLLNSICFRSGGDGPCFCSTVWAGSP